MAAITICSDFGAQKISLTLFPLFPHLFPMKWWDRMPWSLFSECWALSQLFHSPLSPSSRLFSPSSLSAIRVVSSTCLRLLIFLLAILIPACASSSPVCLLVYSAYKLNKQGDNIQNLTNSFSYLEPVCCSMSSSNCCLLTCIQVSQEADQVVSYSHLFQNFPQFVVIHIVKDYGIVIKAEIDVFLELPCFFDDPADVGNFICFLCFF